MNYPNRRGRPKKREPVIELPEARPCWNDLVAVICDELESIGIHIFMFHDAYAYIDAAHRTARWWEACDAAGAKIGEKNLRRRRLIIFFNEGLRNHGWKARHSLEKCRSVWRPVLSVCGNLLEAPRCCAVLGQGFSTVGRGSSKTTHQRCINLFSKNFWGRDEPAFS